MSASEGTRLTAVQRRLGLYLRALWGRDFPLVATDQAVPFIADGVIHLPERLPGVAEREGLGHYRAAAAHAAAHLVYGAPAQESGEWRPRQLLLIALIEDARVEACALARFPGLRPLWASGLDRALVGAPGLVGLAAGLAAALLEPERAAGDAWLRKALGLFQAHSLHSHILAREVGLRLAHDIGQMRLAMDDHQSPHLAWYRDDHRHLWAQEASVVDADAPLGPQGPSAGAARLVEREQGRPLPLTDHAGEATGFALRTVASEAPLEYRAAPDAARQPHRCYPEWDYRAAIERPAWCCVREAVPAAADGGPWNDRLVRYQTLRRRLRRLAEGLRMDAARRMGPLSEGDDLMLHAAIDLLAERRRGLLPEPKVYERVRARPSASLAVLLLLDLSASAAAPSGPGRPSKLDLAREAAWLFADGLGPAQRCAVHGFCSEGRDRVHYQRFKDFHEPLGATAPRFAAMRAGLSTRLGAALRHAGALLQRQPAERRLLMVLSDGEPSDIDVFDSRYLNQDARHAVAGLRRAGIVSFCLALDPAAERAVARIFGAHRYRVIDYPEQLADALPRLYLALRGRL